MLLNISTAFILFSIMFYADNEVNWHHWHQPGACFNAHMHKLDLIIFQQQQVKAGIHYKKKSEEEKLGIIH